MITKSKDLFRTLFFKISLIVLIILASTWGITFALNNDIENATSNFSVLGSVSEISDSSITLINARGSDDLDKTSYEVNINYVEKIETKDYEPLIITDIKIGDTISGQGLTNGSIFFLKRIISFSGTPIPVEVATTTIDEIIITDATTTESILNELDLMQSSSSSIEETSTTSTSIVDTVAGVVSGVVDTVVDTVTGVIGTVIDVITGTTTDPVIDESQDDAVNDATSTPDNSSEETQTPVEPSVIEDVEPITKEPTPPVEEISNEPDPVIIE